MKPVTDPQDAIAAHQSPNEVLTHHAACVLIVDALSERLALLHDVLEESAYNVLAAGGAAEAMALLAAVVRRPELVVLAADLPALEG